MAWQSLLATLLACNSQNSALFSHQKDKRAYDAFGGEPRMAEGLGYNGILLEAMPSGYLLGNGYRFYNPSLRRFHSPDSMSPFGLGALNAYVYCSADPINFTDPSGHASVFSKFLRSFLPRTKKLATVVPTAPSSAARGTARNFTFFNGLGGGPLSKGQEAAVERFRTSIKTIGEGKWKKLRNDIEEENLIRGIAGSEGAHQLGSRFGLAKNPKQQIANLFPDYRYTDGVWKGSRNYSGEFVSHETFALRILEVERDMLRKAGVGFQIEYHYLRNPALKPKRRFVMRRY